MLQYQLEDCYKWKENAKKKKIRKENIIFRRCGQLSNSEREFAGAPHVA